MEMKKHIGNVVVLAERSRLYIAWAQFVLIAYTSIALTDLNLYHFLILIPVALAIIVFDFMVILPAQQVALAKKNVLFMEHYYDVKEIKKEVKL